MAKAVFYEDEGLEAPDLSPMRALSLPCLQRSGSELDCILVAISRSNFVMRVCPGRGPIVKIMQQVLRDAR